MAQIGIVANHVPNGVGVGADDGDVGQIGGEGQDVPFVFEQDDGFAGDVAGELALGGGVEHGRDRLLIHIRVLEETQLEFHGQVAGDNFVHQRLVYLARFHCLHERCAVIVGAGQFHVYARFEGDFGRLRPAIGQAVGALDFGDGEIVGDDEAIKTPFAAQNIGQQLFGGGAGHAI